MDSSFDFYLQAPPYLLFQILFSDDNYPKSDSLKSQRGDKVIEYGCDLEDLMAVYKIVLPYLVKDTKDKPYVFSDSDSDSDCDDDVDKWIETIEHKNLIFLATLYRGYKKKQWIESWCVKDVNVQNWVESTTEKGKTLKINTAAEYCGTSIRISVIIRDSQGRPIVCFSECVSPELLDPPGSIFDEELQSVNKGLELAIKYGIKYVDLHCGSEDAVYFIRSSQAASCVCFCVDGSPQQTGYPPCKICFKKIDFFDGQGRDCVKVNALMVEILKKIDVISRLDDHAYCEFNPIRSHRNIPAEWLARYSSHKGELKPYDLIEYPDLLDKLYEEASGESGMKAFII